MKTLNLHTLKYVAYKLVHKWAQEALDSGGNDLSELDEILNDAGGTLSYDYYGEDGEDFSDNHEGLIVQLNKVLSDLEEKAGKNDN